MSDLRSFREAARKVGDLVGIMVCGSGYAGLMQDCLGNDVPAVIGWRVCQWNLKSKVARPTVINEMSELCCGPRRAAL